MRWRRLILLAALCATITSCAEEFDTTRAAPSRGTLGEEIYEVVCLRIAATEYPSDVSARRSSGLCSGAVDADDTTPPRLAALAQNRARLVDALDRTLPEALEDDLSRFLLQVLPLYDPPTDALPQETRAVADLLSRLLTDDEALASLERLGQRQGYRPLRLALGVARPVLAYPQFDDFATKALATLDTGGAAGAEWDQLLRVVSLEMASATIDPPPAPGTRGTLAISRDLLFSEDSAFAAGPARWLVARDLRGLALPASATGTVPAPFADADADGLADVDSLGRFVDTAGTRLGLPTPFPVAGELTVARDPVGRALRDDGTPLYRTLDASRTLLAGIARQAAPWFDPTAPVALDFAAGVPVLLGPPIDRTERFGAAELAFRGPDTRSGALFDVLHAGTTLIDRPEFDDTLALVDLLLRDHEAELAALIDSVWIAQNAGDANPLAHVDVRSDLWDDTLATAESMSQTPGLLEGIVRELADPASADLGPVSALFMRYSDRVEYNPADLNGPPLPSGLLTDRTDWTQPDVPGNESLFQRSIAVIQDLNGVRVCNKAGAVLRLYSASGTVLLRWPLLRSYDECELLQIDNVAETYVKSVLGRAHVVLKDTTLDGLLRLAQSFGILSVDDLLESQSGIDGLTQTPTPQALGRLVFAPSNPFVQSLLDSTSFKRDRNGDGIFAADETVPMSSRHVGVVAAWEKTFLINGHQASFLSALAPVVRGFDDYDATGGRFFFGEMIGDFYRHWPTRANPSSQRTSEALDMYSAQDDARSYEPVVAELLDRGQLTARLGSLVRVLDATMLRPGVDGVDALMATTNVLVDPTLSCGGSCAAGGGLRYRSGRDYPCTSSGSCFDGSGGRPRRYVAPIYLLVDALAGMDRALEAEPDRLTRWRSARTALTDQLLSVTPSTPARLSNRRTLAMLRLLVPFVRERVAEHRAEGDLSAWADGLTARAEETLGSAATSAVFAFLDAIENDPQACDALAQLIGYLVDVGSSNDAFDTTVVALTDFLQVLEDDRNLTPLLRALAAGLAPEARAAVDDGAALETAGSAADQTLDLLRLINDLDDRHALRTVLANVVSLPEAGEPTTPLETILDVIAEVNRVSPGAGGSLDGEDYRRVLGTTRDLLVDEDRGFERLYRVVQERELAP
jgi:hypothetical protein